MKIANHIYFAPGILYSQVQWDDSELLLKDYKKRLSGFYLDPARNLDKTHNAFASGVIAVCAIDSLTKISKMNQFSSDMGRFEGWLIEYLPNFNKPDPQKRYEFNQKGNRYPTAPNLARRFYKEVRCGLVHEGILKEGAQFDYELVSGSVGIVGELMIINPISLINEIEQAINRSTEEIKNNTIRGSQFVSIMKELYRSDLAHHE